MAYKDANGRITIDEVAAQKDVNNLNFSLECLMAVNEMLLEINRASFEFSGHTAVEIQTYSDELMKLISTLSEDVTETISLIENTVKKYQEIDRSLKETIDSYYSE